MTLKNANATRSHYIEALFDFFKNEEDCGMVASNCFNFPTVTEDGEEGWVEVTVKVTKDNGDDGYLKREDYTLHLAEAKAKAEEKAKAKEAKIARDKATREAKAKARAEAKARVGE